MDTITGLFTGFSLAYGTLEAFAGTMIFVLIIAFIMEYIDSSLGMGYGTVLSPVLIIMGFSPLLVVPSVLLSQAAGGFTASVFHHRLRNVLFQRRSRDSMTVYIVTATGIIATLFAAAIAISIPGQYLNTYIGLLIFVMGIILLSRATFRFRLRKMLAVGAISAFNKGMSGGGFGPVVTGGQMIGGQNHKNAIGVTTAAEAPICIAGFLVYLTLNGISDWLLVLFLTVGAVLAAPLGALTTSRLNSQRFRKVLGAIIIVLGAWTLWKTWM